ncbi:MAG: M16 family metallopeptidase [Cyanophyceae cyanobacterium]
MTDSLTPHQESASLTSQKAASRFTTVLKKALRSTVVIALALIVSLAIAPASAFAIESSIRPYLDRVIDRVSEFTLDNGMKFVVLERHEAPLVSFVTYANVGGVDEPDGQTGVAHFLEHLAFKGTTRIGTSNYDAEVAIMEEMSKIEVERQQARDRGDVETTERLQDELITLEAKAQPYVKQNEYGQIVEQAGGAGLNAATSADATFYFYSFPSNKLELWMSLESERFLDPVFREFYKEQEVILEERRQRTDNSPVGKAIEVFLDKAYDVHPYKRPVIGYNEDIRGLTRLDVRDFFDTYYGPGNLTAAVVGDVDPQEVKRLAEIYFGRFEARPEPPDVIRQEPVQQQEKEITVRLESQPWYFEGYHVPSMTDPDAQVYEAINRLLSSGRTSRFYQSMVEGTEIALSAQSIYGFPGDRFPTLMLLYALPSPGHDLDDMATAIHQELDRLKTQAIAPEDLDRLKTQARASRLRLLDSNQGMANSLAEYQVKTGDWRNLFQELDRIAAITPEDIQRVARKTFKASNRTICRLLLLDAETSTPQ